MNSPSTFASIRFRLVGVFGSVLLLTAYPLTAIVTSWAASVKASNSPRSANPSVSALPQPDKPHTMAGTYYNMQENLKASITLNNKGLVPLEVEPVLFSMEGKRLEVPPVIVDATSFRAFDLSEWAAPGGPSFEQGSLQLFYRGKDMLLGAQIKIIDYASSVIFDEQLSEPSVMVSSRLEGLWWRPARDSQVSIAISNTTESVQAVSLEMSGEASKVQPAKELILEPHQTILIDATQELAEPQTDAFQSGGISMSCSARPGSVFARTMIQNPSTGFSSAVQFTDPGKAKSSSLHGAGLRLGGINGEDMSLMLVARNTKATTAFLRGDIVYTRRDGIRAARSLGKIRLGPGEVKAWVPKEAGVLRKADIESAGLEFDYSSGPGTVLVSALSVSRRGNQVFQVPLLDPKAQKSSTGVYPFYLDYGYSTVVYIKNTTAVAQKYVAHFNYEGGKYMIGVKDIAAGETVSIDVRALRDNQIPDEEGRTIPLDVMRGQARWTIILDEGTDLLAMIGRSELVNEGSGISSTYACQNCCGDHAEGDFITPELTQLQVGQSAILRAFEQRVDCYGYPYSLQRSSASWSSDNQSVAKVSSSGTVTTMGAGQTTIHANWQSLGTEPQQCGGPLGAIPNLPAPIPCCTSNSHFGSASAIVQVNPRIESISRGSGVRGLKYDVTITGTGFKTGATINLGTGVTVTSISVTGTTQIKATFNIADSASGGDRSVIVTVNNRLSNDDVKFRIQIPTRTIGTVDAVVLIDPGPGDVRDPAGTVVRSNQCGAYRTVVYELVDQDAVAIQDPAVVTETVRDTALPPPAPPIIVTPFDTDEFGRFGDVLGMTTAHPSCPNNGQSVTLRQTFSAKFGNKTFTLTTTNRIELRKNSPTSYTINIVVETQ